MALDTTFHSALSIKKIVGFAGNPSQIKQALVDRLEELDVEDDCIEEATEELPPQPEGDLEAVARLVSLARAAGFVVVLQGDFPPFTTSSIEVTTPSSIGLLQAAHDLPALSPP